MFRALPKCNLSWNKRYFFNYWGKNQSYYFKEKYFPSFNEHSELLIHCEILIYLALKKSERPIKKPMCLTWDKQIAKNSINFKYVGWKLAEIFTHPQGGKYRID